MLIFPRLSRLNALLLAPLLYWAGLDRAAADQGWEGSRLTFLWENDVLEGTDRHYTQGAALSFWSRDNALPGWLKKVADVLPAWGFSVEASKFGVSVGQDIFTPADLSARTVVLDDRPYAGWLYGAFGIQKRGLGPGQIPVMETLRMDLGVVGPPSLAEDAQKTWHKRDPNGWGNQLKTEPGLILRADRRYLFSWSQNSSPWRVDGIPSINASAGNISTHLGLSALVRVGFNMPDEFSTTASSPPTKFGAYAFAAVTGRWWLRNLFLDGNTFQSIHHVTKVPVTGDLRFGLTVVLKRIELTAAEVLLTREFRGQTEADAFGSASVTLKF